MKKARQICALAGVILLIALYVLTLVFALMNSENAFVLFKAAIYATVIVPVLIWAMGMIARLLKKHYSSNAEPPAKQSMQDIVANSKAYSDAEEQAGPKQDQNESKIPKP